MLKSGVRVHHLTTQALLAIMAAQEVFRNLGKEFVITSIADGSHMKGSLHYAGNAFDIRTRHLTETEKTEATKQLAARLNADYDVVLELSPPHIHVEYDPQVKAK